MAKSRVAARLWKTFLFPCFRGEGERAAHRSQTALREISATKHTERCHRKLMNGASLNCTKFREDLFWSVVFYGRLDTTASVDSGWLRVCLCTHKALGLCNLQKRFSYSFDVCLSSRSLVLVNSATLIPPLFRNVLGSGVKIVEQGRRTSSVCFAILLSILIPSVGFLIRISLKTRGRKKPGHSRSKDSLSRSPSWVSRSLHHIWGAHFVFLAQPALLRDFFLHLLRVVLVSCHVIFALGFADSFLLMPAASSSSVGLLVGRVADFAESEITW